jgi:hypothetical protein
VTRVTATAKRRRPRTVSERRRAVRAALSASAPPTAVLPTYEMTQGGPAERYFYEAALEAGFSDFGGDRWPCEEPALDTSDAVFRDGGTAVWRSKDGALAYASLAHGWFHVHVAGPSAAAVAAWCASFRSAYPASYLNDSGDTRVPITFWAMGAHGPIARLRRIEAATWEDVAGNYTAGVQAELESLMSWVNGPAVEGQLLLWQGPPGTGKTWALRVLASEWAPWAEFHYITDPDSFFVDYPSYMVDVLLADSYAAIDEPTGDIYDETDPEGKWRVLILEDTGELLSANAKEKYGQGLSRLLNVVDGMIGQGLRVLVLVTTNDELGELNPAVRRPGRCASQIVFDEFSPEEASAWLGEQVEEALTVAEMYARRSEGAEALPERDHPDDPEPEDARDLMASAADDDTVAEVRRVAAEHQPDEPGYGQTAWNAETRTVLWVSWDGTGNDEHDAAETAFLAIPGVDHFVSEAESVPTGWWDAEVVYPDEPPRWVTERPDEEAAIEKVLALARSPLPPLEDEPLSASLTVSEQALYALGDAHQRTVDGILGLARPPQ